MKRERQKIRRRRRWYSFCWLAPVNRVE